MALQTFHFRPQYGMKRSSKPNVMTVSFGDGYECRAPAGIHSLLREYDVTFKATEPNIAEIDRFLTEHAGYKAFFWTPYGDNQGKFKCQEWSISRDDGFFTLTATFKEVIT